MKEKVQKKATSNIERRTSNVECGAASRSYLVAGIQHRLSAEASCEGGSIGDGPKESPKTLEGVRLIPLSYGKYTIVDAEDYERLSKYQWCAVKERRSWYAKTLDKDGKRLALHRLVLNAPKGLFVDHIDHNCLNNRRSNLRLCTQKQNNCNTLPRKGCSSKYKGVSFNKARKRFIAYIQHNKKRFHLGYFEDEIDAAKAYDKKAREFFGEFAYLNFP